MIAASCIKFKSDAAIYWHYFTGRYHSDVYFMLSLLGFNADKAEVVEGFITDDDKFVNRHEAVFVAKASGQINSDFNELFLDSEDIWPRNEEEEYL